MQKTVLSGKRVSVIGLAREGTDLARFLVLGHASDKSSVSPLNDASIELVSATERLCFRETGFAERRKPYGKGPIASIVPLQRQTSRAKGRQYGAFLRALGKFSVRESAWWAREMSDIWRATTS